MEPKEVFLSHSSQDQEFASLIAETLREQGIPVWYSTTNILGAQQWHDEIGNALGRCDWFILILSPRAVSPESIWVKRELLFALQEQRFVNKIIPILYESCNFAQFSWVLPSLQIIDFQEDFSLGCQNLLRLWGIGYKR